MDKQTGKIIIPAGVNVWPHEMETARVLAKHGFTVEFVRRNEGQRQTSADLLMNGLMWEIKSPTSHQLRTVEKNLRKALHQSPNIVFDSRRMKNIPDRAIEREVRKWSGELKSIKHVVYISRHARIIDIL